MPQVESGSGMDAVPVSADGLKLTFEGFELCLGQIEGTSLFLTVATGFNGALQLEALTYRRTAVEYQGERQ